MKFILGLILLIMIVSGTSMCGTAEKISDSKKTEDMYWPEWQEGFRLDITKSLASSGIMGCGQYNWKPTQLGKIGEEFLVRCTSDGNRWTHYIVFPIISKVVGPVTPKQ